MPAFSGGSLCCPTMKAMRIACMMLGSPALAACSLLYNPSNLPPPTIDAPTIVTAGDLGLEAAWPQNLLEGQGTGGSRPAILVVKGHDIAQDATVALVPVNAQGSAPMIEIDNEHAVRSLSGTVIAVPVTLPIDPSRGTNGKCEGSDDVALTVQVTQMGPLGPLTQSLDGKVSLCNLPELDASITDSTALVLRYSRVKVPAGLTFTKGAQRAVIRAVGAIDLGDVHGDASGAQPGPGGAAGGAKGANGSGPGGGRPAGALSGGLLAAGSGGGYGGAGAPGGAFLNPTANPGGLPSGDDLIITYVSDASRMANGSSGGGGGDNNPGGGGGGTIELTAGGTLTVGKISANGAGVGAGNGGGGSGGPIVLRSGAVATLGTISATGGAAINSGGAGGGGRLRYDVPSLSGMPPMAGATTRRGVAFSESLEDNPLITDDPQRLLKVVSAKTTDVFKVFVLDAVGTTTAMTTVTFETTSVGITPTLRVGYNHLCVTPSLGDPTIVESTNCIDIAYVR